MDDLVLRLAISLPGLLLGIVCHEAAHALMAWRFGDNTAASQGRISLNPAVHFDLFGTLIIPAVSLLAGGVMFGYARPVPVDPRRFYSIRKGIFWVSFAGPLANLALALVATMVMAILISWVSPDFSLYKPFTMMLQQAALINLVLFTFNLLPFPPLDGAKMLAIFLDYNTARRFEELQRYSILFFLVLVMTPLFGYLMMPVLVFRHYMLQFFLFLFG